MIKYSNIESVYEDQISFLSENNSLKRDVLSSLPLNNPNHALVISGIRRCGKSTLMRQHIGDNIEGNYIRINLADFI